MTLSGALLIAADEDEHDEGYQRPTYRDTAAMPRPGGSTLVQQSGSAHDLPAPGKRTLTEQIAPVAPVQRSPARQAHGPQTATSGVHAPKIAQPEPGIDQTGFIDNTKGAPIYNRPPEAGGDLVRDAPLPPASRVFASGTYPRLKDWWHVTRPAPFSWTSPIPLPS